MFSLPELHLPEQNGGAWTQRTVSACWERLDTVLCICMLPALLGAPLHIVLFSSCLVVLLVCAFVFFGCWGASAGCWRDAVMVFLGYIAADLSGYAQLRIMPTTLPAEEYLY